MLFARYGGDTVMTNINNFGLTQTLTTTMESLKSTFADYDLDNNLELKFKNNTSLNGLDMVEFKPVKTKKEDPKVQQFHDDIQKVYAEEAKLWSNLGNESQTSQKAQDILKQIETLNKQKTDKIDQLAATYPQNSPEASVLKNTSKVVQNELKINKVNLQLDALRDTTVQLEAKLLQMNPDSSEAKQAQKMMEALQQAKTKLNEEKSKFQKEIDTSKIEIKSKLPQCSAAIKDVYKDITNYEKTDDKKYNESKDKRNQTIRDSVQSQYDKLQELRTKALTGETLSQQQILQLEHLNQAEYNLLTVLKGTYAEGSPEDKAVTSMMKLNVNDTKEIAINNALSSTQNSIHSLKQQLSMVDPGSSQAANINKQIEALTLLHDKYEKSLTEMEKDDKKEKQTLKTNILKSSPKERKALADMRNDKLETNIAADQYKLSHYNEQIKVYQEALNNPNLTDQQKQGFQNAINELKTKYKELKSEIKVDQTESNFWEKVINIKPIKIA